MEDKRAQEKLPGWNNVRFCRMYRSACGAYTVRRVGAWVQCAASDARLREESRAIERRRARSIRARGASLRASTPYERCTEREEPRAIVYQRACVTRVRGASCRASSVLRVMHETRGTKGDRASSCTLDTCTRGIVARECGSTSDAMDRNEERANVHRRARSTRACAAS
jgi:hypothetical protein